MKLLFFDIDGTLMADDGSHYIPQSTYDAILKARQNGHKAFINTGRSNSFIRDIHRGIGFDGFVCGCGTEIIIDGKTVLRNRLTHEQCVKIAEKIVPHNIVCLFEGSEAVSKSKNGVLTDLNSGNEVDMYADDFLFDKFSMWRDGVDDELLEDFAEDFGKDFDIISIGKEICEHVPKGFSKATGMEVVAKHYGLTLDDCIVFGDSPNDLAMIHAAGYAVTMGKCPSVDKYADFVTKGVKEDGIYLAMKHLELI